MQEYKVRLVKARIYSPKNPPWKKGKGKKRASLRFFRTGR